MIEKIYLKHEDFVTGFKKLSESLNMRQDICLSIGHIGYDEVLEHLKRVSLAEIRMDLLNFTTEQFATIFQSHSNLIATYRANSDNLDSLHKMLTIAIENGCKYIDLDISVPKELIEALGKQTRLNNGQLILSYHNFEETPSEEVLKSIIETISQNKAHIAKIACMANSDDDCDRVLELYKDYTNLVGFCMGELGKFTRVKSILLGAPFTYASIKGKETAPGQLSYEEIEDHLSNANN